MLKQQEEEVKKTPNNALLRTPNSGSVETEVRKTNDVWSKENVNR